MVCNITASSKMSAPGRTLKGLRARRASQWRRRMNSHSPRFQCSTTSRARRHQSSNHSIDLFS
ncbi:hypothetical protein L218DRAFT_521303 [Marasmius fiardii PR-910]|nr:hypothetical protein L218DRAFT_521303 [Marasmius fiardii PR-910]